MLLTEATKTGGNSTITWLIMAAVFVLAIFMMSRSGKKRAAQAETQRQEMKKSMTPGTWVRTTSGFFGKVVEISGEVVTLQNLTGEETLWDVRAIAEVKEPNFGTLSEDALSENATDTGEASASDDSADADSEDMETDDK